MNDDRLADIQRHFIEGNERGLVRRDEVVPVVFGDVAWLVAALVAERATNERLRELLEKCACGVDYPDDVCLVHSPQLMAERALSDALAAALETLCNEPTHPYIDEWYNVRKASQAALEAYRSARAERHDSA